MKVHELAKEVGVDSAEVVEMLGKESHLNVASDEEVQAVKAHFAKSPKKQRGSNILRFWSEVSGHKVKCPSGMIVFEDFYLLAEEQSIAGQWLLGKSAGITPEQAGKAWPEIRIVVDKPFDGADAKAAFHTLLSEKVYTGANKEPSTHGLGFINALFGPEEQRDIARLKSLDALIQKAVDEKSYMYCSEWK